jgi:uncharacterized protein
MPDFKAVLAARLAFLRTNCKAPAWADILSRHSLRSLSMIDPPLKPNLLTRPFYFAAGVVLVGVGIAGYFLPVLPGTIWLILAAACFARSSPRFESWLVNHPEFGPSVVAWRQNGAIPRKAKYLAIGMMLVSFVILAVAHTPTLWLSITGAVLLACALFVASRPIGPKAAG